MKVKLFQKVRERYGWYITSSGDHILVDKARHDYLRVDVAHLRNMCGLQNDEKFKEEVTIEHDEWCWRHLKNMMLKGVGFKWSQFNLAKRSSELPYKKMKKDGKSTSDISTGE